MIPQTLWGGKYPTKAAPLDPLFWTVSADVLLKACQRGTMKFFLTQASGPVVFFHQWAPFFAQSTARPGGSHQKLKCRIFFQSL